MGPSPWGHKELDATEQGEETVSSISGAGKIRQLHVKNKIKTFSTSYVLPR